MKVLTSHKAIDINDVAKKNIEKESLIITDKSTSYEDFSRMFDTHISFKSDKTTTKKSLKSVHVAISSAKRNLLGVYHMISNEYLQNYLNEFCYRLNRRYFGENLFNRMVVAVVANYWYNCLRYINWNLKHNSIPAILDINDLYNLKSGIYLLARKFDSPHSEELKLNFTNSDKRN